MAIEEILDLEQLEVDIYRGRVFSPESGYFQRTFGGHVAVDHAVDHGIGGSGLGRANQHTRRECKQGGRR